MSRRSCLLVALLLGSALASAATRAGAPEHGRALQNLILISIDTLRADRLGCYGHDRPTSPSIDKIAREGVLFEDASATSPWTKPSHGSMLTGLYPSRHGAVAVGSVMSPEATHLATLLDEHGFHTAAIVNSVYLTKDGLERGFDDFRAIEYIQGRRESSPVTDAALAWLEQRPEDRRFFLFLHYMDVHSDYRSLPRYEAMFVKPYDGPFSGATSQLYLAAEGKLSIDGDDADHLLELYDAGIRQVDDELGRLFSYLRSSGVLDRSLLMILSDHGEEFLEHGSLLHGATQYQEVLRIPFLARGPGIPAGRRLAHPVSLVDVLPTVATVLGLPAPEGLDGADLEPLWARPLVRPAPRRLYSEADLTFPPPAPGVVPVGPLRAARSERFKLLYDLRDGKAVLFDLVRDPGERIDVIERHPEVAAGLLTSLSGFLGRASKPRPQRRLSEEELERLRSLGYVQ